MSFKPLLFVSMIASVVFAFAALFSGELLLQLLGGLLIFLTLVTGISQIRLDRVLKTPPSHDEMRRADDPTLSARGERLFGIAFPTLTFFFVLALAIYTAWQLGLF